MKALLFVVLVACGGSKPPAQQPVSNATPPADAPAAKPVAACTSDECRNADTVAKMSTYKDQMCACKDKACADHVQEDLVRWANDMAKDASSTKPVRMSEDDAKRITDLSMQFSDCFAKLAAPATP